MKKKQSQTGDTACRRKTTIGGQALIEGLMMIGPDKKAMAVRKPDGSILVEELAMTRFTGLASILFVRGSVRLFRQLVSGTKALLRSAELVDEPGAAADEQQQAKPFERFAARHTDLFLYGSAMVGILFSVGLFILLPNLITGFLVQLPGAAGLAGRGSTILRNLVEGLIRIVLFVSYLMLASRLKDIRRVWMYHGAEHKAIACYESGQDLTVDNARSYSRFHPRCGTAFLFLVILVSIIVFSLIGWWNRWINLLIRLALVPLVAGIAYELIRLVGRSDNVLARLISLPGLWLQRLTTAEPDDGMLEVAIAALDAVRPQQADGDRW